MNRLRIAFAAGDVGGARAILPVIFYVSSLGHEALVMENAILRAEGDSSWQWYSTNIFKQPQFLKSKVDVLVYATSVVDRDAVDAAIVAKQSLIPIIHLLDNWSNYNSRLFGSQELCIPDCYALMDELAKNDAISDGVPVEIIKVTGQPAFAKLAIEFDQFAVANPLRQLDLLFVSEPVLNDQGDPNSKTWRGYDEEIVSSLFAHSLKQINLSQAGQPIRLRIASHPRENADHVKARWEQLYFNMPECVEMVESDEIREALQTVHCVIGMASALLYESWLLGKPTLSLQPGLRDGRLRVLEKRSGVIFCDDEKEAQRSLRLLLKKAYTSDRSLNPELKRHVDAAKNIIEIILSLCRK